MKEWLCWPVIKPIKGRLYDLKPDNQPYLFSPEKPTTNRFCGEKPYPLSMLSLTLLLLLLSLPLLLPGTAIAAQTASNPAKITLQTALQKTLQQHPDLPQYQQHLRSADGYIQQAGVGERPQLNLSLENALGSGQNNGLTNLQTTLSLSWVMEGELLDKRVQKARTQKTTISAEEKIIQLDIAAKTTRIYLAALYFQERQKLAQSALTALQQSQNAVQKQVKVGAAPQVDLLRANVAQTEKELELADIRFEIRAAIEQLAAQWAELEPEFLSVEGDLTSMPPLLSLQELNRRLQKHPNLELYLSQQRLMQSQIDLAEAEAKAHWRFQAGVRRNEASDDLGLVAGFSLPLGKSNRNAGRIKALSAEQAGLLAKSNATRIQLTAQLSQSVKALQRDHHAAKTLQQQIIPQLSNALIQAQKAYQLGKYSFRDWSSVQAEWLSAKNQLLQVQYRAHLNRIEIERLTGLALKP